MTKVTPGPAGLPGSWRAASIAQVHIAKIKNENSDKEVEFSIVGPYEANLEKGFISVSSPLAKGLMSKESGSQVEIKTPSGLKNYEILNIDILKSI